MVPAAVGFFTPGMADLKVCCTSLPPEKHWMQAEPLAPTGQMHRQFCYCKHRSLLHSPDPRINDLRRDHAQGQLFDSDTSSLSSQPAPVRMMWAGIRCPALIMVSRYDQQLS